MKIKGGQKDSSESTADKALESSSRVASVGKDLSQKIGLRPGGASHLTKVSDGSEALSAKFSCSDNYTHARARTLTRT